MRPVVFDLGLLDFHSAVLFQKAIFAKVKSGALKSALIVCRHKPVITLGRLAKRENILAGETELRLKGIEVYQAERGGDVTYHGPGQLTAYPIINLNYFKKDIHLFLRKLENIVIDWLSDFGITAVRYDGLTGVWLGKQKIASIGIAVKNWITFHGVTINIKKDDLDNFGLIRPCGMNIEMVPLEGVIGREVDIDKLKENLIYKFKEAFDDQSCLAGIR